LLSPRRATFHGTVASGGCGRRAPVAIVIATSATAKSVITIVWSGTRAAGQKSPSAALANLIPGTLRVVLEEAADYVWKTVREQNLSVSSR
jgi:hypothetical protein